MDITTCPKCGYKRRSIDQSVMLGICPSCGIAYQKWVERQQSRVEAVSAITIIKKPPLSVRLKEHIFYIPDTVDPVSFWGRVVLLIVFFHLGVVVYFGRYFLGKYWRLLFA